MPSPLSVNVTPVGSAPVSDNVHVGIPVDVTVRSRCPADGKGCRGQGLVNWHAWLTVRVKVWVAAEPKPFVAVIVNGYVPPVPAAGVPESVAVPSPLSVNVTPVGSAPVSDNAHVGGPVDVTVKAPGLADGEGGLPAVLVIGTPG